MKCKGRLDVNDRIFSVTTNEVVDVHMRSQMMIVCDALFDNFKMMRKICDDVVPEEVERNMLSSMV